MTRGAAFASAAVLAAAVAIGARGLAQSRPDAASALRSCARADLLGAWQVLRIGVVRTFKVDTTDPTYFPHQRYVFDSNANMFHLASTKAISPDEQRRLLAATPPATWAVDTDGRLLTQRVGQPRLDNSTCQVVVVEIKDPKSDIHPIPGDVLLTLFADGKPVVRRLLRRIDKLP